MNADKKLERTRLITERQNLPDRYARSLALQSTLRAFLIDRNDVVIGAYWPIKGEFDALPALYRWQEDALLGAGLDAPAALPAGSSRSSRKIGLPVVDRATKTLEFHAWWPGCPMEPDAYDIPKPKGTEVIVPTLLLVPCLGYSAGGYRLGYGGGFYDRTLASLNPKPFTVGLGFANGFVPDFAPEPHDVPLDAILTDHGQAWPIGE